MAKNSSIRLGVLWLILTAVAAPAAPCNADGECPTETAAALQRRRFQNDKGVVLLQFAQVHSLKSRSAIRLEDAQIAVYMRDRLSNVGGLTYSLMTGLEAIDTAATFFMRRLPQLIGGVASLAKSLFSAVKGLVPEEIQGTEDFDEFESAWMKLFTALPSMVESIDVDIREFASSGSVSRLVRSINALVIEASTVVTTLLPEQIGVVITKFLGAIADVFDGIGEAVEHFEHGDIAGAVGAIFEGLKIAGEEFVPAELQNDETYKAIVGALDGVIGSLSRHLLAYKQKVVESNVCWKVYKSRERKRPKTCDHGYAWDGVQWCVYNASQSYMGTWAMKAKPYSPSAKLDYSVQGKSARMAVPARCDQSSAFNEKRGPWCYSDCPAGYEVVRSSCITKCGSDFPIDSEVMCGRGRGSIRGAITKMFVQTSTQLSSNMMDIAMQISKGKSALAAGMNGTIQSFLDMGKPFIHPVCPTA